MKTTKAAIAQSLIDELMNESESEENDESDIDYDPIALEDEEEEEEEGEEEEIIVESNDMEEPDAPETVSTRPTTRDRKLKIFFEKKNFFFYIFFKFNLFSIQC